MGSWKIHLDDETTLEGSTFEDWKASAREFLMFAEYVDPKETRQVVNGNSYYKMYPDGTIVGFNAAQAWKYYPELANLSEIDAEQEFRGGYPEVKFGKWIDNTTWWRIHDRVYG